VPCSAFCETTISTRSEVLTAVILRFFWDMCHIVRQVVSNISKYQSAFIFRSTSPISSWTVRSEDEVTMNLQNFGNYSLHTMSHPRRLKIKSVTANGNVTFYLNYPVQIYETGKTESHSQCCCGSVNGTNADFI
jgi:hypothetical protein